MTQRNKSDSSPVTEKKDKFFIFNNSYKPIVARKYDKSTNGSPPIKTRGTNRAAAMTPVMILCFI
jgi:hypothetical protein